MARSRLIRPEFFESLPLSKCSHTARLLFISLWAQADRDGILKDLPLKIHGEAFPYEPTLNINLLLDELHNERLIVRYEVKNKKYITIPGFPEHQKPHKDERCYNYPKLLRDNRTAEQGNCRETAGKLQGEKSAPSISISISNSISKTTDKVPQAGVQKNAQGPKTMMADVIKRLLHVNLPFPLVQKWSDKYTPEYTMFCLFCLSRRTRVKELGEVKNRTAYMVDLLGRNNRTALVCCGGDDLTFKEEYTVEDWYYKIYPDKKPVELTESASRINTGLEKIGGIIDD